MSDGKKTCLGFAFLILGLTLAVVSLLAGGIGEMVKLLGGESLFNFKAGIYVAIGLFLLLFIAAMVMFISIRDWSWLPAIFGGVYTILPDLIVGPEDDVVALVLGVVVSGLLSYISERRQKQSASPSRPEALEPPEEQG
jgi:hypothetical protein